MSRLVTVAVCLPSIFEFCVIAFAAFRTQQFFALWLLLAAFTATKFSLKYVFLLQRGGHEKTD
jgi:hypothetical protein